MMGLLANSVSSPSLTWQSRLPMWPPVPAWLLVLVFVGAVGLVVYLYRAQREIASRGAVVALTAVRLAILALLLVMMLQPALKWTYTSESAGTLWLVVDQSLSMGASDPQSSPVERLRWADALGYLPTAGASARESRLDVAMEQLACLRETLLQLKPTSGALQAAERDEGRGQAAAVAGFVEQLKAWNQQLGAVAKELERDPGARSTSLPGDARSLERTLESAAREAAGARTLREASGAVMWGASANSLSGLLRDAAVAADRADEAYLARHRSDAAVQDGLRRLDGLTRADLAYLAMTTRAKREGASFAGLFDKYRTKIVTFADTAQAIPTVDAGRVDEVLKTAFQPTGKATSLAAGLQLVGEQVGADEHAVAVIVSDGRQNVPADPTEPARLLAARGVRVSAVAIGSAEVAPDAAVDQIDAPERIFKDDTLKADAVVRLDGLAARALKVEFLRNGQVVDTRTVQARNNQDTQRVSFTDRPPEVAVYEYEVRVEKVPAESNYQNNAQSFRVAVKKDKLSALLVEDQPRWEYQYLKNYLGREKTLTLQTVLLSPARIADVAPPAPVKASPKNPRPEAQLLPETKEEWQAFDLVALGDVPPASLTVGQQQMLAAAVRDKGATLIVVAGANHMPGGYANTPLAALLPVELASDWDAATLRRHVRSGFRPALAPEGAASVLGQLGPDAASNAALWGKLPVWYWHAEQTQVKPAASALWVIGETDGEEGGADLAKLAVARKRALLSSINIGLGRVLFLGADQTWRMRQVNGANLQDQFWGQVVRWAVGSDLPAGGRFVRFGASRQRYNQGEPVMITARILKEDLTPYAGLQPMMTAKLVPEGGKGGKVVDTAPLRESSEAPGFYRGTFTGLPAGTVEIALTGPEVERLLNDDPTASSKTLMLSIAPQLDVEHRNMNTDRRLLAAITQAGGGATVDGPYADVLAGMLPEVKQTRSSTEQLGFFTDPKSPITQGLHWVFLGLFAVLLTAEWGLRKRAGMI